ncbi:MAG: Rdx family protein [Desulfotignum sp.]|nr:Rdx family protein [Desulfotignum sp.]MCF8113144.1 Rdx family protein [Desulfotignum sp.]MCF8125841.1 Rdx family protein [Desulfotignum sp.]
MADAIKNALNITPKLVPGSNGIYDITAGEKTIFSKHQAGRFPENPEIIDQLRRHLS